MVIWGRCRSFKIDTTEEEAEIEFFCVYNLFEFCHVVCKLANHLCS